MKPIPKPLLSILEKMAIRGGYRDPKAILSHAAHPKPVLVKP